MSGGVDSAVAAARVKDAGHDVIGVHLALSRNRGTLRTGSRGCCTVEDAMDARRVAQLLDIPFYVWDFSEKFAADVVANFIDEYEQGRTPNPCLRCNEKIKFEAVLDRAMALGFDAVATGHYAKVVTNERGRKELHRAADWAKDQSYVLGVLTSEQLDHCMFPLADTPTKEAVRAEAAERGFSLAQKPDSHDICFIPDGDTQGYLRDKLGTTPGTIVDQSGEVLGHHEGTHQYTVGQRKGLQIGYPAPDGKPRFVLDIRPVTKEVVVGPREALATVEITGGQVSFAGEDPIASGLVQGSYGLPGQVWSTEEFSCLAQVRAHGETVSATARIIDGQCRISFAEPLNGVAKGQSAVMYIGSRVLGQVTIDTTVSTVSEPVRA
jgi:tRNA-specific 2-thiouridylase